MTEQIYNDFINKALPTIAQGAKITKEYAIDLLGRYAQYQVVSNSLLAVLGFILLYSAYRLIKKGIKVDNERQDPGGYYVTSIIPLIAGFVLTVIGIGGALKCGFVPEICAIEAIQGK